MTTSTLSAKSFSLGKLVMTPAAMDSFGLDEMLACLSRHQNGDWGTLSAEDKAMNNRAVTTGDQILSAYEIGLDVLWVITEGDRSVTTLLLPSDY